MNDQHDDKEFDTLLHQAVGSEDAQFNADLWKQKHAQSLASLGTTISRHKSPSPWRTFMTRQPTRIAASSLLAAGIIIAALLLTNGGPATTAIAAALEQLKTQSYTFNVTYNFSDDAEPQTHKGIVLEPGKLRLESADNQYISIYDREAKQGVLLLDGPNFNKVAMPLPFNKPGQEDAINMTLAPFQTLENIWNLKADDATPLPPKQIQDQLAEGFQTIKTYTFQEQSATQSVTQTITVWANADTRHPITVIASIDLGGEDSPKLIMAFNQFKIIPKPDPALFDITAQPGYTFSDQQTLSEYKDSANTTSDVTSPQAKIILEAITLWNDGKKQKAAQLLATVDWQKNITFSKEHPIFTMTEKIAVSLMAADREKIIGQLLKETSQHRSLAKKLEELGTQAQTAKDYPLAEKHFLAAAAFGDLHNRNSDMMLLVRMQGVAIQQHALPLLSALYQETGDAEKQTDIHSRIMTRDETRAYYKKMSAGN